MVFRGVKPRDWRYGLRSSANSSELGSKVACSMERKSFQGYQGRDTNDAPHMSGPTFHLLSEIQISPTVLAR